MGLPIKKCPGVMTSAPSASSREMGSRGLLFRTASAVMKR